MPSEPMVAETNFLEAEQPAENFGGKLAQNKSRVVAFLLMLLVLTLGLGYLSFVSNAAWIFLVQMMGFLFLGLLHSSILRTNLFRFTVVEKTAYSFLFAAVVFAALALLFHASFGNVILFVTACGCAFVLPYAISEASYLFSNIGEVPTATWRYDESIAAQKATTFLNSIPIRFRIEADAFYDKERIVSFRAPVRMKLGTIFYHTVQEQSNQAGKAIDLLNPENQPFEWSFSVKRFGFTRFLDPEAGLIENNIKPNTVIIASRLPTMVDA